MNNYSRQRETILEVIKELKTHPTAEEIYNAVILKDERISKRTVYRNINVLLENGLIRKITMSVGADRYDYVSMPHDHIICEKCGRVYDFFCDVSNQLNEEVKNQLSDKVSLTDNIVLNGICYECKSKK